MIERRVKDEIPNRKIVPFRGYLRQLNDDFRRFWWAHRTRIWWPCIGLLGRELRLNSSRH